MRINQVLDLGHSAIIIQEDVQQFYGLSKLYNVWQSATCFVVKSSKKAKSVRQFLERSAALLFTIATSLSIFRAYGSELIDSGVRNTTSQAPTTYSQSTALLACPTIPQLTALPAYHIQLIDGPTSLPYTVNRRPC